MPKPMEKPEKQNKQLHPMPPVQFLRPSLRVDFFCVFGFLEVFATSAQKCQNPWKNKKQKVKVVHSPL
jgi:hypothetical protein